MYSAASRRVISDLLMGPSLSGVFLDRGAPFAFFDAGWPNALS